MFAQKLGGNYNYIDVGTALLCCQQHNISTPRDSLHMCTNRFGLAVLVSCLCDFLVVFCWVWVLVAFGVLVGAYRFGAVLCSGIVFCNTCVQIAHVRQRRVNLTRHCRVRIYCCN
jgi:hypothetical protein